MSMSKRSLPEFEPVQYPADFHEEYSAWSEGEDNITRAMLDLTSMGEAATVALAVMAEDSGRIAAQESIEDSGFDYDDLTLDLKAAWRMFADGIETVSTRERNEAGAFFRAAFWLEVKRQQQVALVITKRSA